MPDKDIEPKGLERTLGLWAVFSIAAGAMISSGLFVLPGLAFAITGPSMILAYAVAGVLNIPTMLAQAELVTAMPKSAGSYFVVERSLGAYLGTIAGLINWCAIGLKAAFALIGIGTIADLLFPGHGIWLIKTTAICAGVFFTGLNLVSVEGTGRLQGLLVAGLLGILALFVVTALPYIEPPRYQPFFQGSFQAFAAVTGMVFVSYGGLTKVVDVAEEVINPKRTLPLGMFLSYAVVNVLYVGVAFVTVGVLSGERLSGSLRPVTDAAAIGLGAWGIPLVGLGAFLAYATTGNAGILSASRSPMAMSRDGLLPAWFAKVHPRFKTPHISIALTGAIACFVIAFLSVENLVKTASTMLLLSLGLINLSVIVMRHSRFEGYRPSFRMPLCPWLPMATLIIYSFLIAKMGPIPLIMTLAFIAAGSVWYVGFVQHRIDRESAAAYMVRGALSKDMQRAGLEDELVQISLERDNVITDRFDHLVNQAPLLDLPQALSVREFFHLLSETMAERIGLPAADIEHLLHERERQSSTVIHLGLAVPHIVVPGEHVFEMILVRCRAGITFGDLQAPVQTVFALAGSADQRNFHLRALMAIAHIVQDEVFQQRWLDCPVAGQLRDLILLSRRMR